MENKQLADKLDENLFSSKIFNKIYTVFAFIIILGPILETFFACFGLTVTFIAQYMILSLVFVIIKVMELIFNRKEFSLKNFTIIDWLVLALFCVVVLSCLINGAININFLYAMSFFAIFVLFSRLDKKWYKILAFLFICEMTFSTFLGFCDLGNVYLPGFYDEKWGKYAMSMQFLNPNWSSLVVIIAVILSLYLLYSSNKISEKIFYLFTASFMSFGLYVGGSYAPETALYLCEFGFVLYYWIKNKKCPWWIFSAFLINVASSFIVWCVPVLRNVSTANANYFYESLAVIDNNLGTNLAEAISTFFSKIFGGSIITNVAGADGWDRGDLKAKALSAILASPKSFIIGNGCAYIYEVRVHNIYYVMAMEFGVVGLLIYLAIAVLLIVKFIKSKKDNLLIFMFAGFLMILFASMYCCIEPVCYHFILMLFAVFYSLLKNAEPLPKKQKKDELKLEETRKNAENLK